MVPGEPNAFEPVLAGSADFVALVSPEVKSRVGASPRVAADPRQAFSYCSEQGGLLVLEYGSPDWLTVVRDLRSLCGEDISMVVAVAPERVDEVAGLQHAGADEVVVWEGQAQSVSWAVERVLAGRATPMPAPPRIARPAPPPQAARTDVFDARAEAPPVLQRAAPGNTPVPAAPASFTIREAAPPEALGAPPGAWPSGVIADAEAERLLALAVSGATPDGGPAAAAAVRLAGALSPEEASALAGAPAPLDGALLRRLAALRLRLALALETAPAPGGPHDLAAVQSMLAEVDGGLQELKAAAEAAAPEVQATAEQIRNAVVGAAIDLTDVVQRIAPSGAPAVAPPVLRGPATRVLSNRSGDLVDERPPVRKGWLVVLGLVAAATAAFHGYNYATRLGAVPAPTVGSAPSGSLGARVKGGAVVTMPPGKAASAADIERFRQQEEARGNEVVEVSPGTFISRPAGGRAGASGGGKP